ncbi:hypothetical protein ACFPYJ_31185 [Paenibacillus solisilvae]|uniref:Uncharacterized protein n=1 Tax=Paenibacillus solisilvae TaxID=2486751 RepID=A0ABW0WAF9_9BACL
MSKFLDTRTSQNANTGGSIEIALAPMTPTAIGVVGLNVTGADGELRVTFSGIAAINLPDAPQPEGSVIVLAVVRGTTLVQEALVGDVVLPLLPTDTGVKILNLTISDYNVPYPSSNQLVYSLAVFSSIGGTRAGPESFYASAYSD